MWQDAAAILVLFTWGFATYCGRMPKHLCKETEENGVVTSRAPSRSGRHRFHVPGPKPQLTRILRVWVWLPQLSVALLSAIASSGKAIAASRVATQARAFAKVAISSLREALPTQADAANLARRLSHIKSILTDPQTPQRAATAIRNGFTTAKDAAPTRAEAASFARGIGTAGRTAKNVLTDPQTPQRVATAVRRTTHDGLQVTRSAVNDPRGTYRAVTERIGNSAAALTTHSKAGIRNSMALLGCAAIISLSMASFNSNEAEPGSQFTVAAGTTAEERAERSGERNSDSDAPNAPQGEADPEVEGAPNDDGSSQEKDEKKSDEGESESKETTINTDAKPVKGLDKTQMANALAVVEVGEDMDIPKRGQAIALMTVMQETKFYNLASDVYPSSLKLNHEGVGSDHDSVGIFQQRPSMGWGSVKECMDVEYATTAFYSKLVKVDDWEDMKLTEAAQKVQGSAFPNAYAQWDDLAYALLDEFHQ